jgi:putative ABC transport system substrate-binding protein
MTWGVTAEFEGKRLQTLKEALPKTSRVAVLQSKAAWEGAPGKRQRDAAALIGLTLLQAEAAPNDYARAFATVARERPDAILAGGAPWLYPSRLTIIDFANRNRIPLFGADRDWTEAGALMSYSGDPRQWWWGAARFVDRILKGAKPSDLPVEQPTKFELVINLKTAKALGLTIAPSLLQRADELIQ